MDEMLIPWGILTWMQALLLPVAHVDTREAQKPLLEEVPTASVVTGQMQRSGGKRCMLAMRLMGAFCYIIPPSRNFCSWFEAP